MRRGVASSSLPSTHPLVRPLGDALACYTGSPIIAACLIVAGSVLTVTLALGDAIVPQLKFVWHCFLRPLGATDQRTRLDKVRSLPSTSQPAHPLGSQFYKGQADVYDTTRSGLFRGCNTMLRLSVGHLRTLRAKDPSQRLIWVDIGGGTGAFASFHLFVPAPIMIRSHHRAHGQALSRLSVRRHLPH